MSLLERIMRDISVLPLREQVDIARYVRSKNPRADQERDEAIRRLHGTLSSEDAAPFEEAVRDARQVEHDD